MLLLSAFLKALSFDDEFRVTARDWHRLHIVLHMPGAAKDLGQLRAILRSVLVGSEQQSRRFDRRFASFFDRSTPETFDVPAALEDFRRLTCGTVDVDAKTSGMVVEMYGVTTTGTTVAGTLTAVMPPRDIPAAEPDLPRVELIAERPIIEQMDEEQLGEWLNDLPPYVLDPDAPTYFSMNLVCPEPPRILHDDEVHTAADSLGFFLADTFSSRLDVHRSIDATLRLGGLCSPRFEHRRQLLSLLLLRDESARDLEWNTAPRELADGLRRHGVTVATWSFAGVPNRFTDERGRVWELEDLEELRRQSIVLLITDGHGMFRPADRRPLERMSRWPRVALLDPRPRELADWLPGLARQYRLPLFPCDGPGVIACLRRFTSESGTLPVAEVVRLRRSPAGRSLTTSATGRMPVRGHYPNDADGEAAFLGDLLPSPLLEFAQACSLTSAVSLGLADRLRRKFFACPPTALGRLLAVHGTRRFTCHGRLAGFAFSTPVRDALLAGFQQQAAEWQQQVAEFVRREIRSSAEPFVAGPPGVAELLARFEAGLVWSFVSASPDGLDDLARILKTSDLSAGLLARVEPLLSRIRPAALRELAETRLRRVPVVSPSLPAETPEHLARIPAGEFWMGDPSEQGDSDERRRHRVYVSEFFLEKQPVTWSLWQEVHAWAKQRGYEFGDRAQGKAKDHPVQTVSWFDAVKWCNARSQREGLTPCFYEDEALQRPYQRGEIDALHVAWDANGYRLPTEAEWEKAARGGLEGQHFPWPSPGEQQYEKLITKQQANFGGQGGTSAVGKYAANGFGLLDMAGNVREWCWDFWDSGWYKNPDAQAADTRGPSKPNESRRRVIRGGSWAYSAGDLRCASRLGYRPGLRSGRLGFRVARGRVVSSPASPERSQSRLARVLFELAPPASGGEITLTAARSARVSDPAAQRLGWNEPADLPAGLWQGAFTSPGFAPAQAQIEARPFHERIWQVSLAPLVPENLARIPAGKYRMGDPCEQGWKDERPRHEVYISEFFLEKTPVTWSLWQQVCAWARDHGYQFGGPGAGKGDDHPAQQIDWHDAVIWCNARSQMEGLEPCYFAAADHAVLIQAGKVDFSADCVRWPANGYRLPTEAEWEKAARGGLDGQHYPWESPANQPHEKVITDRHANYHRERNGTSPVADYPANGYGLHDMAGNVWQWCWDFWDSGWYGAANATSADSRGPEKGDESRQRVIRGGGWANSARNLRCAFRDGYRPGLRYESLGFRVARGRVVSSPASGARDERERRRGTSRRRRSERA